MKSYRKAPVFIVLLSLSIHALAVVYYELNLHLFPLPERWHLQILALLLLSAVLSPLLIFLRGFTFSVIVIAVKFLILVLIGYPLGEYMGVETILIIPLLVETVWKFAFPYCVFLGAGEIFLVSIMQDSHTVWNATVLHAQAGDLLFFGANSLIVLFLSSLVKYLNAVLSQREYDLQRLDTAVEKITSVNLDYQAFALNVERISSERERQRITREIHDIIGYTLTNQLMIIQAALVYKDTDRTKLNELLLKAQSQVNESIEDARKALRQLRETELPAERGLQLFLKLGKTFESITGVAVEMNFANVPSSFPTSVEKTVYRFLQEGMTNAFRHGKAARIKIHFWCDELRLYIQVQDDGITQPKFQEGIGLKGMRERFSQLDGGVTAGPVADGFCLKAWIPADKILEGEKLNARTSH